MTLASQQQPEDLVVMGRVAAPYAVSGWLKIHTFTQELDSLLAYPVWRIGKPGQWRTCRLLEGKVHGQTLLVSLEGIGDRNTAETVQGFEVAVERAELPPPAEGEYYWDQLTDLEVVNQQGDVLGRIVGILESGAHELIRVQGEYEGKAKEWLIPFVAAKVISIDLTAQRMVVDWGLDY